MPMDANAYARQLKQLLPRGPAWKLESDSWISKLMLAIGDELARIEARGEDLLEEADPRTATETLDDWERVLGLPDDAILTIPTTDAERRLAITQKLVKAGGQDRNYFIALAAACGYTVTIDDTFGLDILRSGFSSGDACWGVVWSFYWKMIVQPPAGTAALSHTELEAIIRRVAPAHTVVAFEYL
jgi:uncharacterized protein YmfQ (DUF2313 family)